MSSGDFRESDALRMLYRKPKPCKSCRRLKAEVKLLRETLEKIADGPRNTLDRRLAKSTLAFNAALQPLRKP